jgi:hypothetical protein
MYNEQANNKEQQQVDQEAAAAQIQAVFNSMGQTMLGLAQRQAEHAQVINEVVADRNQQLELHEAIGVLAKGISDLESVVKSQGEMIQAQDAAIKALVKLQTSDHITIEYLGHQRKA